MLSEKSLRWCLAAVAGLLLATAGEGPDFGHYTDWAAAALSGDIFTLRGNVLSPGGVPFTVAAAGPGLLFAVIKALAIPLTLETASLFAGWIAAIVFWCSAFVVLRRVARGNWSLTLFGASLLFIGTHAGFYSHVYATEVFADALVAALWALALARRPWGIGDSVLAGALAGLLLLVRAHVVLYAIPALWIAAFGIRAPGAVAIASARVAGGVRGRDQVNTEGTGPTKARVIGALLATAIPLAIAVGEYAAVNRWMTGSLLHPPYVYGGAGFSSVDLRHPEVGAVLVHSWHGLLAYHPLYAVAFLAMAVLAARDRERRLLWLVTLVAVVAHLWVQAGWYVWWLGGSTFGMRGMAPAALPLIAGLVALMRDEADVHPTRACVWAGLSAVACAWSYPLLLRGYTDYFSWPGLIASQTPALVAMTVVVAVAVGMRASTASASVAFDRMVNVGTQAGFVLVLAYLAWQVSMIPSLAPRVALGAGAAVVLVTMLRVFPRVVDDTAPGQRTMAFALAATVAIFGVQAMLFARLAVRTERHVASGAPPPREFEYVGASPVDELRVTYAEYLGVPGFTARKRAFRTFLGWQRIAVSKMSPQDRVMAEAVWQRLDAEPAFADGLVEVTVRDGVVRITGSGITDGQQSRARQLAAAVPGVQSVTFPTN